jgi:phasin family protein
MASQTNPFGDVTKMLEQFKVPGVDMGAIVESRRKDIEVLTAANKALFESMQAMAKKQTEMLTQAMQSVQEAAQGAMAGAAADPAKQGAAARKAFEKTIADMKELADMARHAQSETMAQITQRANQHMQEMKTMMRPG